MSLIAIVYHSGYGHTAKQAEAVARGALSVAGATAALVKVEDIDRHWADLEKADAIIFGSPTYMGSASAPFKTFMDASSKVWAAQGWKDKLAAGFTNSASQSGDKLATLQQLAVFAAQHGMIWIGLGLMPGNNSSAGKRRRLEPAGRLSRRHGAVQRRSGAGTWADISRSEDRRASGAPRRAGGATLGRGCRRLIGRNEPMNAGTDANATAAATSIDPGVRIGHVHLKVANLERALAFYVGVLGFA